MSCVIILVGGKNIKWSGFLKHVQVSACIKYPYTYRG